MIIGGVVVGLFLLMIVLFLSVSLTSKKLVCKSSVGNITIMYTNKNITGYTAKGLSYDLDTQQEYAKRIGVDAYLKEFTTWFETNTDGTCK